MNNEEIWKDIAGYEGLYQVSNLGRIKSLNYKHTSRERILKTKKNRSGYVVVNLNQAGKRKTYSIHRLVAQAFIDNPQNLPMVNHRDENKQNNIVSNLEWCTSKYNTNYGTCIERRAKKTSKPVIGIDKVTGLIVKFPSAHEASRQTGIDQGYITNCLKGRYKTAGGFYWYYANVE